MGESASYCSGDTTGTDGTVGAEGAVANVTNCVWEGDCDSKPGNPDAVAENREVVGIRRAGVTRDPRMLAGGENDRGVTVAGAVLGAGFGAFLVGTVDDGGRMDGRPDGRLVLVVVLAKSALPDPLPGPDRRLFRASDGRARGIFPGLRTRPVVVDAFANIVVEGLAIEGASVSSGCLLAGTRAKRGLDSPRVV